MTSVKHFLDLNRFDTQQLRAILDYGTKLKSGEIPGRPLEGKSLAMIFEKPSTRTRVSFEVGISQLGGDAVLLDSSSTQMEQGESIADTARVLSRFVDAIMIRTSSESILHELAEYASVPVINGLTDESHPCQLMADIMTYEEHRGSIAGKTVTWCGDGNNVATSWIHAAVRFGFHLKLATPAELPPNQAVLDWAKAEGGKITVTRSVEEAATDSDCIVTDTWVSMGDTDAANRHNLLKPYQVDQRVMGLAKPDALFMHCLPAHRGEEVTEEVIDGPQSVVFDEAGNRLHAQKGIMYWCMSK
ncbi:ornithine carbamoyltransferase [Kiloniella laminariae]|uniref:Ornithine carbamoyltransferase n=1 Tax=Kiloniella laminariae TaxID=454162 RepID=A0ABT4LMA7_9PROT|nr:ornithine carbamoyltransferase [Kiloniella laminariae]MCZ4282238.1 ornithine carbamoyltransferase [Kiloniella laminariae]